MINGLVFAKGPLWLGFSCVGGSALAYGQPSKGFAVTWVSFGFVSSVTRGLLWLRVSVIGVRSCLGQFC